MKNSIKLLLAIIILATITSCSIESNIQNQNTIEKHTVFSGDEEIQDIFDLYSESE